MELRSTYNNTFGVRRDNEQQKYAAIAQLVERIHGKDEVTGSNPVRGSRVTYLVRRVTVE